MSHDIIKINRRLGYRPRWKRILAICRSLNNGAPIIAACQAAGVGVTTLWMWRGKYPKLDKLLTRIYDSRTQVAEDMLFKNVMKGYTKDIHFFLMNRAKSRFNRSPDAPINNNQVFIVERDQNGDPKLGDKERELQERTEAFFASKRVS